MTSQTIMWTVLPNGIADSPPPTANIRLSLFVSPKLRLTVPPYTLEPFPDFWDWPQTLSQMEFAVQFGSEAPIATQRVSPPPDSLLWHALFPQSTFVRPHEYPDYTPYAIRSYPVADVFGFLKAQYQSIALDSPTKLPLVTELMGEDSFGAIHFDRERERELSEFINELLDQHKAIETDILDDTEFTPEELGFFQAAVFHRAHLPLQDPDDPDNSEPVPIEIPEIDFHQKVSSLGDYPELLRRLGLVIDLEVPFEASIPQGTNSSTVRVAADSVAANDERPMTRYWLDDTRFVAEPGPDGTNLGDGWLRLGDDQYNVLQVDVDGAALKTMNFAKSLFRAQDYKTVDTPETAGVPTLRSSGLGVVQANRAARFVNTINRTRDNMDAIGTSQSPPALFAEDLVRGYRVDVWDNRANAWHSLCRRRGLYNFLAIDRTLTIDDEGFVSMGVTEASDGSDPERLYLHESLFGWSGWSLCVPRVEFAIGHQAGVGDTVEDPDGNDGAADLGLETTFSLIPGTLPRLRFGYTYRLRARTVDLAGNSLSFESPNEAEATVPITYNRFEPLSPPTVILRQPVDDSPGESARRLVIRSNFDTVATGDSQRHIVPPRTTQLVAETHGMFDVGGVLDKTAYTLIVDKEAPLPDEPVDELSVLPYLPDPIGRGASFYSLPGLEDEVMQIPFAEGAGWPDFRPFRIRLVEGQDAPSMEEGVLTISLAKAELVKVQLSSYLHGPDLELMGIWQWLRERIEQTYPDSVAAWHLEQRRLAALLGRHWLLTPFQEITLVHAVQQPLQEPQFFDLSAGKKLGETHAELRGEVSVHGKSSSKLDILAEWQEWVDDPRDPGGPRQITGQAHVCEVPVEPEDEVIGLTPSHEAGKPKRHDFGDTKYRAVDYMAVATTRFQEYFPEGTTPLTRATEVATRVGVQNSARPLAPKVLYVLPTFGWQDEETGTDERFGRTRRGGGLRIYLERPWYSSGEGELLGVVLGSAFVPNRLRPYVTLWGTDPIWGAIGGTRFDSPGPDDFGQAQHIGLDLTLDELPEDRVTVAGHEVHYDEGRQLWYCDIELDTGNAYYPFVRLALARYQPESVPDAHLSRVVLADFAQLAPDRRLTIIRDPADPQLLGVRLSGPAYVGSHLGAHNNEVEVAVERRLPEVADELLGWAPIPATNTSLTDLAMSLDGSFSWSGEVTLPQLPDSPRLRLIVKEYERFEVDGKPTTLIGPGPQSPPSSQVWPTNRRLVYADALEIRPV